MGSYSPPIQRTYKTFSPHHGGVSATIIRGDRSIEDDHALLWQFGLNPHPKRATEKTKEIAVYANQTSDSVTLAKGAIIVPDYMTPHFIDEKTTTFPNPQNVGVYRELAEHFQVVCDPTRHMYRIGDLFLSEYELVMNRALATSFEKVTICDVTQSEFRKQKALGEALSAYQNGYDVTLLYQPRMFEDTVAGECEEFPLFLKGQGLNRDQIREQIKKGSRVVKDDFVQDCVQ